MRLTSTLIAICLVLLSAFTGAAETRRIQPERFYNSFDHRHPVLARVKSGDTIVTRTIDAGGYDEHSKKTGERGNPLTGPFFVEGAEPGDSISIQFGRIRPNRDYGFSTFRLLLQAQNEAAIEGLYPRVYKKGAVFPERDEIVKWNVDRERGRVSLAEPKSQVHPMEFAARPMLGCVGVAAPGVFAPTSGISGPYGGNMDYNEVVEGTTLHLPVYHPGALLFIGDGHALQADGEPTGTGVEVGMDVTFTIALNKGRPLDNPRLETADFIASIGSQPEFASSLDRSIRLATSDMVKWLTSEYRMEPWAAHLLVGYQGRYDVVTVAGSMALRVSRSALPKR